MKTLFFDNALLPNGWARNVLITADDVGIITAVTPDSAKPPAGADGQIAVAGMANLHSHAFQRAMAGLGEWRGSDANDSFWTWRDTMYRFLDRLRPQDLHAVAAQLYVEMLEAGFTAVGEFHYVHHQPDGTAYDDPAEMSARLMAAASDTGIAQTLLPVFYHCGGFNAAPVASAQLRFFNEAEQFLKLVDTCRSKASGRVVVGIAPHSLRAVTPESLDAVIKATPEGPVHIHIAEQVKEVKDCIAWSGARPVQWLYDNQQVDSRWCLVHATHMDDIEIKSLAESRAVAGLCPITEANLGDGIFEGVAYHQANGKWGIGSDSNVRIDLAEELRTYEYSQRLRDLGRTRIANSNQANGRTLFDAALAGGAQALGQNMGNITIGNHCDIVSLDAAHPIMLGKRDDDWLNSWIFGSDKSCVRDVWASGALVVKEGKHIKHKQVAAAFGDAMKHLTQ